MPVRPHRSRQALAKLSLGWLIIVSQRDFLQTTATQYSAIISCSQTASHRVLNIIYIASRLPSQQRVYIVSSKQPAVLRLYLRTSHFESLWRFSRYDLFYIYPLCVRFVDVVFFCNFYVFVFALSSSRVDARSTHQLPPFIRI